MTDNTLCVVFDIDDTLYLERDYVGSGFAAVGAWIEANLGFRSFSDRCWIAFRSGRRPALTPRTGTTTSRHTSETSTR